MKAPIIYMEKVALSYDRIMSAIGSRFKSIEAASPKLQGYLSNMTDNQLTRMNYRGVLRNRIGRDNYYGFLRAAQKKGVPFWGSVRDKMGKALLAKNYDVANKLQDVNNVKMFDTSAARALNKVHVQQNGTYAYDPLGAMQRALGK